MKSNKLQHIAKIAGFGYLVIFITGIFANFFVLENMYVPNESSSTFTNLLNNEDQFRFGFLCFIVMVIFDIVLTWALYLLFEPVNRNLSLLGAWFRLVNTAIFGVALFKLFSALHIATSIQYTQAFGSNHVQAEVMLAIEHFNHIWLIGLLFFGIHLFVLAYLMVKSQYVAKFIGILLFIASAGYVTDSIAQFTMQTYSDYKSFFSMLVIIPGVLGELSFTFWLLFRGNTMGKEA